MFSDMSDDPQKSTMKRQIDENLKRIYDETLQEQIPDRLISLLQQLRDKGLPAAAALRSEDEGDA